MKKSMAFLVMGLLTGLVLTTSSAQEKKDAKTEEPGLPKETAKDKLAKENAEKLATVGKLLEYGRGKVVAKGGVVEGWSIESLIAAARLLKDIPPPDVDHVLVPDKSEVTVDKDAAPGADTKLPPPEKYDPKAQIKEIIAETRAMVKDKITDKEKQKVYMDMIDLLEKDTGTKAVAGGPRVMRHSIPGGHHHAHTFHWHSHLPGMVAFQASIPMRLQIVQDHGGYIFADGITMGAAPQFLPGGPGVPHPNKKTAITVRVLNPNRNPGVYMLGLH